MRAARRVRWVASLLSPLLLVGLAVVLLGCNLLTHEPTRSPSIAGVVVTSATLPDGKWEYRLTDGQVLIVDYAQTTSLHGGPSVGSLLLAGDDPDGRRWIAGLSASPNVNDSGCFWLTVNGRDAGDEIQTSDGLRLRKAAGFDPGLAREGVYASPRGYFCLNDKGEVTNYVSA